MPRGSLYPILPYPGNTIHEEPTRGRDQIYLYLYLRYMAVEIVQCMREREIEIVAAARTRDGRFAHAARAVPTKGSNRLEAIHSFASFLSFYFSLCLSLYFLQSFTLSLSSLYTYVFDCRATDINHLYVRRDVPNRPCDTRAKKIFATPYMYKSFRST